MNRYEFASDKKKEIKELIELNGLFKGMHQAIAVHVDGLSKALEENHITGQAAKDLISLVDKTFKASIDGDELMTILIRAHEKHLTQEEVRELIEFMKSEKMVRMAAKMKVLNEEMVKIGQDWMDRQTAIMKPELDRILSDEKARLAREKTRLEMELQRAKMSKLSPMHKEPTDWAKMADDIRIAESYNKMPSTKRADPWTEGDGEGAG